MSEASAQPRSPSMLQALTPLLFLIAALATSVYLYADDSSYGANQIALLLAGGIAALVGLYNGLRWDDVQQAIVRGISIATPALLILLAVGALIGTWILSGTVPTLIVYGLELLHPSFFYPAACLICALVAVAIGSSWTVAGTLGVALMGVASGLDMSPAITAGAIISGAYFGDKMSPLSDTTNLAPAAAGGELFAHVRHMAWTTVPAFVIALVAFTAVGLTASPSAAGADFGDLGAIMGAHFNLGLHLLIPMVVVFGMAIRRVPAYPTILIGALLGALFAVLFQADRVVELAANDALSRPMALLSGAWKALFDGYSAETGNAAVDSLISRGGMSSMLNTVWLILCAMAFGAVMETAGLLERLIRGVLTLARSTGSLIASTIATAFGCNLVAADQYMAIVLTGRLFKPEYEKRGLAPENLSRALEDGGTLTSPLVPWNTCGAYMAATLGVATLEYLPYVFFNLVSPVLAGVLAYAGYKILRTRAAA
ncbi:MAG: Na+/H+ antiporter NhaC [Aquimonas sp.]|nr:Na+/H+ antiporter NhaC [Aquimonas sp.]